MTYEDELYFRKIHKKRFSNVTVKLIDASGFIIQDDKVYEYRTHNRSWSLSWINYDYVDNVDKGSRQDKPVTSG